MNNARIFSLYSGSGGNSFLISTNRGAILIDAGKNAKRLCAALAAAGVSADEIRAIFITHEHSDHVSALPVFLKKHPVPVHIQRASAYKLAIDPAAAPCLCLHPPHFCEQVEHISVRSFPTPHDSMGSLGFRIEIENDDGTILRIGYATDIGYVTREIEEALLGCDAVILESNHDPDLLQSGPYPYELKRRIASRRGHLSNGESAHLAAKLCAAGTKGLMLAHLSRENNDPTLAYDACFCAVGDERVRIAVADPDEITELTMGEETI